MREILNEALFSPNVCDCEKKEKRSEALGREGIGVIWMLFYLRGDQNSAQQEAGDNRERGERCRGVEGNLMAHGL